MFGSDGKQFPFTWMMHHCLLSQLGKAGHLDNFVDLRQQLAIGKKLCIKCSTSYLPLAQPLCHKWSISGVYYWPVG